LLTFIFILTGVEVAAFEVVFASDVDGQNFLQIFQTDHGLAEVVPG
jgi:hypothetical protein